MSLGTLGEALWPCDDRMELPFPDTCDSGWRTREGQREKEGGKREKERGNISRVVQSPLDGQTVGRTNEFPIDI